MTNPDRRRTTSAYLRLLAIGALLLTLATFACRPAWSPDGKRLLFASVIDDERMAIGLYDRDTGAAEVLHELTEKNIAAPLWTEDGTQAVLVCGNGERKRFTIVVVPVTPRGEVRTFHALTDGSAIDALVESPVLLGRSLFIGGSGILRVDLDTGTAKEVQVAEEEERFLVVRAGKGLGYAKVSKGDERDWEIGRLDSEGGAATPLLHGTADLPWEIVPTPAFSPDGSRIAVPAHNRGSSRAAILVFADGKLETTLPIDDAAMLGNVAWAPDSARLFATYCRRQEDGCHVWGLLETMVGGSVWRETPIATTPPTREQNVGGLMFQVALSPDGRTAALSTAMLEGLAPDQHGLFLIDLAGPRKVERVPFPLPAAK